MTSWFLIIALTYLSKVSKYFFFFLIFLKRGPCMFNWVEVQWSIWLSSATEVCRWFDCIWYFIGTILTDVTGPCGSIWVAINTKVTFSFFRSVKSVLLKYWQFWHNNVRNKTDEAGEIKLDLTWFDRVPIFFI